MRKQSGITLVEVLIVIGIILVIFAIATPVYKNGVQKVNELDTKMRLAQVYKGIMLYDADYPDSPRLHPELDVPLGPIKKIYLIEEKLKSREPLFCKIAPACARTRLGSTHTFGMLFPSPTLSAEQANEIISNKVAKYGAKYNLVTSHCEDEVYYQPREKDLGRIYQRPFILFVTPSGSLHSERRGEARHQILANACKVSN